MRFYAPIFTHADSAEPGIDSDKVSAGERPLFVTKCHGCGHPQAMLQGVPPERYTLRRGRGGWPTAHQVSAGWLVTDEFVDAWLKSRMWGLLVGEPVIVKSLRDEAPHYSQARILRSRTVIDPLASGAVFSNPEGVALRLEDVRFCPECHEALGAGEDRHAGIAFRDGTWDGADVFRPLGYAGKVIVTERFASWWDARRFTGISFSPAETTRSPYGWG